MDAIKLIDRLYNLISIIVKVCGVIFLLTYINDEHIANPLSQILLKPLATFVFLWGFIGILEDVFSFVFAKKKYATITGRGILKTNNKNKDNETVVANNDEPAEYCKPISIDSDIFSDILNAKGHKDEHSAQFSRRKLEHIGVDWRKDYAPTFIGVEEQGYRIIKAQHVCRTLFILAYNPNIAEPYTICTRTKGRHSFLGERSHSKPHFSDKQSATEEFNKQVLEEKTFLARTNPTSTQDWSLCDLVFDNENYLHFVVVIKEYDNRFKGRFRLHDPANGEDMEIDSFPCSSEITSDKLLAISQELKIFANERYIELIKEFEDYPDA